MEGMSINPATMGMDIMMVLNEDGTATLTSVTGEDEPQVQEAAWKQEESGIVCPACGTLNREGAIFCKTCGSELVQEEIRCPNCNELLDGDEIFCPKCGTKIQ